MKSHFYVNEQYDISQFELSKAITFSKIFSKIKLSHSARAILRHLIDYWNPSKGYVYPSIDTLIEVSGYKKTSVIEAINQLKEVGLMLTTRHKKGNRYYFTPKLFELLEISHKKNKCSSKTDIKSSDFDLRGSDSELPYIEQITVTNKKHYHQKSKQVLSSWQNDDLLINSSNIELKQYSDDEKQEYKQLIDKLESWSFSGSHFVIKTHGLKKINELCSFVEDKNPSNKGAYLRSLLNISNLQTELLQNNFKGSQNKQEGANYISANEIIKKIENEKKTACTPLDFSKEEQIEYYYSLPEFAKNGFYAKEIKKRWNLD